ncbi:hypothetical protein ACHAW5_008140 [Stephanodiscus triporus]|uniref:Uncharacterized protein n=1 Tax=Stephanodiscus triporus TaxID=2934178 RepID=A0ABD3PAL8_9STRA
MLQDGAMVPLTSDGWGWWSGTCGWTSAGRSGPPIGRSAWSPLRARRRARPRFWRMWNRRRDSGSITSEATRPGGRWSRPIIFVGSIIIVVVNSYHEPSYFFPKGYKDVVKINIALVFEEYELLRVDEAKMVID